MSATIAVSERPWGRTEDNGDRPLCRSACCDLASASFSGARPGAYVPGCCVFADPGTGFSDASGSWVPGRACNGVVLLSAPGMLFRPPVAVISPGDPVSPVPPGVP